MNAHGSVAVTGATTQVRANPLGAFAPNPLRGEDWGEGTRSRGAALASLFARFARRFSRLFRKPCPSPRPSPRRGEGEKSVVVGFGLALLALLATPVHADKI